MYVYLRGMPARQPLVTIVVVALVRMSNLLSCDCNDCKMLFRSYVSFNVRMSR